MQYVQSIQEIRCPGCKKVVAKGAVEAGYVELQCRKCKSKVVLRAKSPNPEPHDGLQGAYHAPVSSYPDPE